MQSIVQVGLALLQCVVALIEFLFALRTSPSIQSQMRMLDAAPRSVWTSHHHERAIGHDGIISTFPRSGRTTHGAEAASTATAVTLTLERKIVVEVIALVEIWILGDTEKTILALIVCKAEGPLVIIDVAVVVVAFGVTCAGRNSGFRTRCHCLLIRQAKRRDYRSVRTGRRVSQSKVNPSNQILWLRQAKGQVGRRAGSAHTFPHRSGVG